MPKEYFEKIWELREEKIYPEIFGEKSKGIAPLSLEIFSDFFNTTTIHPMWLSAGIITFLPTKNRKNYLYASSGLSNPLSNKPLKDSIEIVLETEEYNETVIYFLQIRLAFELLVESGKIDQPLTDYGQRTPLREPIYKNSRIQALLSTKPSHFQSDFEINGNKTRFVHFVGITKEEFLFAKENGNEKLIKILSEKDYYPITNLDRSSAI